MKPIDEIIQARTNKKMASTEQDQFASRLNQGYQASHQLSSQAIMQALSQMSRQWDKLSSEQQNQYSDAMTGVLQHMSDSGIRLNNLDELPSPETNVSVNLQGIDHIEVKTATIVGLDDKFGRFQSSLEQIVEAIKTITIMVPEIKAPEVKVTVPKPEVTVNIPPMKIPPIAAPRVDVPKTEVTITRDEDQGPRLISYLPQYDSFGNLVSFTEYYEDGTKQTATGFDKGKVTISYD